MTASALILNLVLMGAAALFAGLWAGERGRRKDLAWLVEKDRAKPRDATVADSPPPDVAAAEMVSAEERQQLIDNLIEDTGCSPADAERDVEQMLAQLSRTTAGGW